MALRDQPYLPLYVQDFLTDEKLIECSAQSVGVYIKIMCILHKQDEYGVILLKQKDKQSVKQEINFANKIAKSLPWSYDVIYSSLIELLEENVLYIDGDKLCQKRMIKDCEISLKRSVAGKKGGDISKNPNNFAQAKLKAKGEANSEYENEYESVSTDVQLIKDILNFFDFSENINHDKLRSVRPFVICLTASGRIEYFKTQFESYKKIKLKDPKFKHNLENFMGTPSEVYEDGKWNSENWAAKDETVKIKPNDFEF